MALLDVRIRSEVLGVSTSTNIILPKKRGIDEKLPVLWLLHGKTGDQESWTRYSNIERYVRNKQLCVIMPAVNLSYYCDMYNGYDYLTYITKELPEVFSSMFNLSRRKEDNYVAGLSMGGYGAFKVALNFPDNYKMAASLSGNLDIISRIDKYDEKLVNLVFGSKEEFIGSKNDLRHIAKLRKEENNLPELYMCCGKKDFLYQNNLDYLAYLNNINIPVTYEEDEEYAHEWRYWDLKIQRALEWMEL
jgi:S-formylglutathione hydrolase FrmB